MSKDSPQIRRCKKCKVRISRNAKFCPSCGERQNVSNNSTKSTRRATQKSNNDINEAMMSEKVHYVKSKDINNGTRDFFYLMGTLLAIFGGVLLIGAIAVALFASLGVAKYPILVWIIALLVLIFFQGSAWNAAVFGAVFLFAGGFVILIGKMLEKK